MISKPTKWIKRHAVNTLNQLNNFAQFGFHQKNKWLFSTPTEYVLLALTTRKKIRY